MALPICCSIALKNTAKQCASNRAWQAALIVLMLVSLVAANAGDVTIGVDEPSQGWGPVFEENGNKWVLWGAEGDIWQCQIGNTGYFDTFCDASVAVNANCVVIPISWRLIEPLDSNYQRYYLEIYLNDVHQRGLKALIMWAGLGYAAITNEFCPNFVLNDTVTYTRCQGLDTTNALCPSDPDTLQREAQAYAFMMDIVRQFNLTHDNMVLGVNVASEINYMGAFDQTWWYPPSQEDLNHRRCSCSNCNAVYSGQEPLEFMTQQVALYVKGLVDAGAAAYDIPQYTPVAAHKFFTGWRYAEDPTVIKATVNRANHFVCPSVAETSSAAAFVTEEMDYFQPQQIPGNFIFADGIDTGWPENQARLELAPWYNIFWYGGLGACYWNHPQVGIHNDMAMQARLRTYWGPLLGLHYWIARLKTQPSSVRFWWQYEETHSFQSLSEFAVDQQSTATDYGVALRLGPQDLAFAGTTKDGPYTMTVTRTGGWDGYSFERGYFDRATGVWHKDADVTPTIEGNDAVLVVDWDSGDYTRSVMRYYRNTLDGDLNNDQKVDILDLQILIEDWMTGAF